MTKVMRWHPGMPMGNLAQLLPQSNCSSTDRELRMTYIVIDYIWIYIDLYDGFFTQLLP